MEISLSSKKKGNSSKKEIKPKESGTKIKKKKNIKNVEETISKRISSRLKKAENSTKAVKKLRNKSKEKITKNLKNKKTDSSNKSTKKDAKKDSNKYSLKEMKKIAKTEVKIKKSRIYKEPNKSETETTINILHWKEIISIYTNKVDLQKKLRKILGVPTKEDIRGRSIVGARWDISIESKNKISQMILKANLFEL